MTYLLPAYVSSSLATQPAYVPKLKRQTDKSACAALFGKAMQDKIAVYVPSTTDLDKRLSAESSALCVDTALTVLAELFGGASAQAVQGAWLSPTTGRLVRENVTVCYVYCESGFDPDRLMKVKQLALLFKSELAQESVAVEINNRFYLI